MRSAYVVATALSCLSLLTGCPERPSEERDKSLIDRRQEIALLVKAKDLRLVTLHFVDGSRAQRIVYFGEVDRLAQAALRLQNNPGVNPYTSTKTSKLEQINVWKLSADGPFWWSTPDLLKNYDPKGATVFGWNYVTKVRP